MPKSHILVRVRRNHLPRIARVWRDEIAQLAQETAEEVRDDAEAHAPYETGALHDSIVAQQASETRRLQWVIKVDPDIAGVDYSHYVHFGTIYMAGNPFLEQALERHDSLFQARINQILRATGHM